MGPETNRRQVFAGCSFALLVLLWMTGSTRYLDRSATAISSYKTRGEIPNQVHYVWLVDDPDQDIKFSLEMFLSIYGALVFCQPEKIYIHTDASSDSITRAKGLSHGVGPDKWASLIFSLPRVIIRRVVAPTHANVSGVEISKGTPHKADFIKVQVMYEFGGVYMDWDAHILRDVKPLRESGFRNVLGVDLTGRIMSGTWMAKKGSDMGRIWMTNQHIVYDGGWVTHANLLVDKIAGRLLPVPNEILVLSRSGFIGPTGWEPNDRVLLFQENKEASISSLDDGQSSRNDADALWENQTIRQDWEWDFSGNYIIHAFKGHEADELSQHEFMGLTMGYLLKRNSNFAVALSPIVRHAIEAGLLPASD